MKPRDGRRRRGALRPAGASQPRQLRPVVKAKAPPKLAALEQVVLAYLLEQTEPLMCREIADGLDESVYRVRRSLGVLRFARLASMECHSQTNFWTAP